MFTSLLQAIGLRKPSSTDDSTSTATAIKPEPPPPAPSKPEPASSARPTVSPDDPTEVVPITPAP